MILSYGNEDGGDNDDGGGDDNDGSNDDGGGDNHGGILIQRSLENKFHFC